MLVFVFITILNSNHVSAAASTLTLTIDSATISANVAPTNDQGTFKKATASTITASTNNATGYTLTISAPASAGSDYDKLINTTDNTAKLNSITAPTTEEQYKTLTNTSYNNTWGYLPSKYCSDGTSGSCAANTSFLPAPTTTGDVLDQTTAANSTANSYTIGMGTRIDSTTKTGKYQGSFIVKLVANAIPYSIIYDDNAVSNMPTDVSTTTPDASVTIDSKVPVRAGYKFLGWCTVVPTNNNGTDTCTGGTQYQPSATLTIDQTGTGNNFHLYAMWGEEKTIANSTTMQEVNSCPDSLPTGQIYTIKDSRDNTEYHTAKLADGKCWLLDNLALDLTDSTVLSNMNENNTHASNTTLNYLKNGGGTTSDKYAITGVVNWTDSPFYASSNSYSDPLVNLTDKDVVPTDATSTAGQYKVGGYYNYCAASAGSYCYGDGASYGTSSGKATEDICPKGWRMPTGSPSGEYSALANKIYGSTSSTSDVTAYANYRSALRLPLSGYVNSGTVGVQGSYGSFWSSTRSSNHGMSSLYLRTSNIYPAGNDTRSGGYSVRCVLGS